MGQCAEIDAQRFDELGLLYSEELWNKTNFQRELPNKFEFSHIVFDGSQDVQGFWIASRKESNTHHTHRVAIRKRASSISRIKLGSLMGERSRQVARQAGCDQAQLTVNRENKVAISFYNKMGYRIVRGEELRSWVAADGSYPDKSLADDSIVVTNEYRLAFMKCDI